MRVEKTWPRIAVVGAGAVGGYFGGMFAAAGAPVVMVGRKPFADAVNANGLVIDGPKGEKRVKVQAASELKIDQGRGAGVVLREVQRHHCHGEGNRALRFTECAGGFASKWR